MTKIIEGSGHNFDQKARAANEAKGEIEQILMNLLSYPSMIKTGDPIYKVLSDAIEKLNDIAYHEKEEVERKND